MTTSFSFGDAEMCELAHSACTVLAPDAAGHPAVADPRAATRAALVAPLNYPALDLALAPGDRVAIPLGKGVPHALEIVRGALDELLAAGIEPQDVTVVVVEGGPALARELGVDGVPIATHDANDDEQLAMIGMTAAGRPLRFNRALVEADVVLPISAARQPLRGRAPARFAGLFPQFSSRKAIDRWQGQGKTNGAPHREARTAEADEAGWLLGVGMTVEVVPGASGGVAAVIAGEPQAVANAGAEQFQSIWARETPQAGDLVIAAVSGDAAEQTWDNVARAVAASGRVLGPDGAIAVYCDLESPPGGSFDKLLDAVDFAAVAQRLRHDAARDARPALALAQALERGPVYLRSRLPDDVVESLGMTPIGGDAELARLAAGRRHCVVIEEAQRLKPRLKGGAHGVE